MFAVLQGRIHQLEYAMEAVKQGSAAVGLKNKTHAVLVALKVSHNLFLEYLLYLELPAGQNAHLKSKLFDLQCYEIL